TVAEGGCGVSFSCKTNEASDSQAAVQFDPRNVASAPAPHNVTYWKDILLRFNSWQAGFWWNNALETNATFSNVRVVGNTGQGNVNLNGNCAGVSGLSYAYNAFTTRICNGSGSVLLSSAPFVNDSITSADLHLTPGSAARGLVTATGGDYDLALDFDGEQRSAPRDAGSDEAK
ncbi:MAG: hypothetical protein H0V79_00150, partial [Actinobacteria bacterium]|nr:hypothetical protein [Actinomycetota bacterium]